MWRAKALAAFDIIKALTPFAILTIVHEILRLVSPSLQRNLNKAFQQGTDEKLKEKGSGIHPHISSHHSSAKWYSVNFNILT